MKLPEDMMRCLRGRRRLEEDDVSQDHLIESMDPVNAVIQCTAWRLGDGDWALIVARWMVKAGAQPKDFLLWDS